MSFYDEKTSYITGRIAALKTIVEKSKNKNDSTISNVSTLMDSIMEIFRQLGGYDDMLDTIEKILSEKIENVENSIKSAIKIAIKQIISCSVEPTVSESLIVTGITFSTTNIDPMSILSIQPTSENGTYAYFDNLAGLDSRDFNVFLYAVIKESINNPTYSGGTWYKIDTDGNEDVKVPVATVSYVEYNQTKNQTNSITIKADVRFSNEKLSYFISEYLDSVRLFNNVQVLSNIFDEILGTKIISISKTTEQILAEDMISKITDNILNNVDDGDVIDDSYYQFSNDVYNQMIEDAERRKNGIYRHNNNSNTDVAINQEELLSYFEEMKTDNLLITKQTKILSDTIDQITNDIAKNPNIDERQKYEIKINLINNIIKKLMTTITSYIFSPKILYLFVMTSKILEAYDDNMNVTDFIKKNINLYKTIILKIRDIIIQELIKKITIMLGPIIKQVTTELVKEKFALYRKQIDTIRNAINAI